MDVFHDAADNTIRRLYGPADVYRVADGEIYLRGEPAERDASIWAPALGFAVMRGIPVRRTA